MAVNECCDDFAPTIGGTCAVTSPFRGRWAFLGRKVFGERLVRQLLERLDCANTAVGAPIARALTRTAARRRFLHIVIVGSLLHSLSLFVSFHEFDIRQLKCLVPECLSRGVESEPKIRLLPHRRQLFSKPAVPSGRNTNPHSRRRSSSWCPCSRSPSHLFQSIDDETPSRVVIHRQRPELSRGHVLGHTQP